MTKGKIFLVGEEEKSLEPMVETPYEAEEILQVLLEKYPDLLPGDQITPEDPKRWVLISREMSVPSEDGGGGTWSLDHLFVDQDGVPTFVECKRAADTRIRREVVAQMLDYAANGTRYWTIEKIRQAASETAGDANRVLNEEIEELLGTSEESEIESFWDKVGENLKDGKVRLLFVADSIPRELRRLIEFMNEKMLDLEVLGVEIKQFVGSGSKAVVPRLIGLTEQARDIKEPRRSKTNRNEFFKKALPESRQFFENILDSADERGYITNWGTVGFSVRLPIPPDSKLCSFAYCYPDGCFQLYLREADLPDDIENDFKARILDMGEFSEGGKYSLTAYVNKDNQEVLTDGFNETFRLIKEFVSTKA